MDLKETELGHAFRPAERKENFRLIYGGVSWPGKNPGFAVVVGMGKKRHLNSYDIFLLEEYESFDIRELVRQCGVLNFKYRPSLFFGDWKNDAAGHFIDELNEDNRQKRERDSTIPRRQFELSYTPMLEMERLYQLILPQIKELCRLKQLIIKEGKIANCLRSIQENEISELELGNHPSIEALAFAAMELRDAFEQENKMPEKPFKYNYDPLNGRSL